MKRYAVLDLNNVVSNIIVAKSLELAEEITSSTCVAITPSTPFIDIGYSYSDGIFSAPETPAE